MRGASGPIGGPDPYQAFNIFMLTVFGVRGLGFRVKVLCFRVQQVSLTSWTTLVNPIMANQFLSSPFGHPILANPLWANPFLANVVSACVCGCVLCDCVFNCVLCVSVCADSSPDSPIFVFFSLSLWGSSRGILVVFFEGWDPEMCTFGISGCRVKPDTQREKRNENGSGRGEK